MKNLIYLLIMFISININAETYKIMLDNTSKSISNSIVVEKSTFAYGLVCSVGVLNEENRNCVNTLTLDRGESCPSGYVNQGNGTCSGNVSFGASEYCSSGSDVGNGCLRTSTRSPSLDCPSGHTDISGGCRVNYGYATNCPSGHTYSEPADTCYDDSVTSPPYKYVSPTCSTGFKLGSSCFSNNTVSKVESCTSSYTLSGGVCTRQYVSGYNHSCPSGYNLSGTTCSATNIVNVTIDSCPPDYYELNATTCEKVEIIPAIINCPNEAPVYNEALDACTK